MGTLFLRQLIRLGAGLALLALSGLLAACAVPQTGSIAAVIEVPTLLPTATQTLPPPDTATWTPTPSPSATATPSATPLPPTETPIPSPTAVVPPPPLLPPQPDGIQRSVEVLILMYHYISTPPSANDLLRYGLSVTPDMFEAQLKLLSDNGFKTITLREMYDYLAVGKPLPEKPIILTFDDGYLDNFTNAFPLLKQYGMTGTFFVLTGPADDGNPNYLSWNMIQVMSDNGMDIQLHSRDHYDMRGRSDDWLFFQIIGGRQSIEGHTGKPVIFMAYPSGKYDSNVLHFLKAYNFWGAVTTASGKTHVLKDALIWDRVRISGQMQLKDYAKLLGIRLASDAQRQAQPPLPTSTPRPASLTPTASETFQVSLTPTTSGTETLAPTPTTTLPSSPLSTETLSPTNVP